MQLYARESIKEVEAGLWDQQPEDNQKKQKGKEIDTDKRNMRRNVITKGAKIGMA